MINTKLWTALITPMHQSGEIHFGDLEKLIRRQDLAGNGILLIGSTGEGLALNDDEKKEIIGFSADLDVSVPLMAGVGGFQIENQKAWIQFCNDKVDAFLMVAPLYSKPGPVGQKNWFLDLMDVAEKPCMIYNIPSRTGVKIPPTVIKELSGHSKFWSIKEASGSIADYKEYREMVPQASMFSGDDALLPFFAAAGCSGLVSVSSNVWPEETAKYVELSLEGKTDSLFPVWKRAVEAMFSAPNPVPVKALLHQKGIIESSALRAPLTEKELNNMDQLKQADEEIINWYKKNNN